MTKYYYTLYFSVADVCISLYVSVSAIQRPHRHLSFFHLRQYIAVMKIVFEIQKRNEKNAEKREQAEHDDDDDVDGNRKKAQTQNGNSQPNVE